MSFIPSQAALCASDLLYRFNVSSTLYSFGEPRVGDYEFARILTEGAPGRAFRCVLRCWWFGVYRFCCWLTYLHNDNRHLHTHTTNLHIG